MTSKGCNKTQLLRGSEPIPVITLIPFSGINIILLNTILHCEKIVDKLDIINKSELICGSIINLQKRVCRECK